MSARAGPVGSQPDGDVDGGRREGAGVDGAEHVTEIGDQADVGRFLLEVVVTADGDDDPAARGAVDAGDQRAARRGGA